MGVYGNYNYGQSTLDKYKTEKKNDGNIINKPLITADITGSEIVSEGHKKPFSTLAKKLEKPAPKPQNIKPPPISPNKISSVAKSTDNNSIPDLFEIVS